MRSWFRVLLAGSALLGGLAGLVWQWQSAAATRRAAAGWRQAKIDVPAENVWLKEIIATGSQTEAARHVRGEIAKTRQEIAALELFLQPLPAPTATHDHFSANRDPEKGPVRLEHFQDMGRATPSAAFQTAVWAMTKGMDDALVPLFGVSPAGREKLQAMLARMTPETQARYHPPEKLLGMLLARDILDEEGFEIGETSGPNPAGQVMLPVHRVRNGRKNKLDKKYPFQPGPHGWQLPITDKMIDDIPAMLAQASMYVPPPSSGAPSKH